MRPVSAEMAGKLMAAAELFADRGLDDTKTEDIAAATGIPKATIYYYFEGKEEVLSFIFGVVLDALHDAVTGAVARPGTAAARLEGVIEAHLGVFAAYPKASQALHFDLGRAARIPEVAERSNASFIAPVSALLREGAVDGSLEPVADPRLTAIALLGMISTAAIHVLALEPEDSLDSLRAAITPLVLDGLRARGPDGQMAADR
jgi:AcrR family transcriptional regulator